MKKKINMNTTLLKIYSRYVSTRINVLLASAFIVTMALCYKDYYAKKQKDPTLPWFAMFLRIPMQPSWDKASPFSS